MYLSPSDESSTRLDTVIDLVSQKTPSLKVLEINLDETDTSTLWFQGTDDSARAAYASYEFASPNAKTLVNVQSTIESKRNTSFHLITPTAKALGLPITEPTYDLAIIKAPKKLSTSLDEIIKELKALLTPTAFTLLVRVENISSPRVIGDAPEALAAALAPPSPETPGIPSEASGSGTQSPSVSDDTPLSSLSSSSLDVKGSGDTNFWTSHRLHSPTLGDSLFTSVKAIASESNSSPAYLCSNGNAVLEGEASGPRHVVVARFHKDAPVLPPALQATLEVSGWSISTAPIEKIAAKTEPKSVVLVLDELYKPVLTGIGEEKWEALKELAGTGKPLLWVTKGGQTSQVTDPDNAMVQGLFRVVRRENPQAHLTTLDVQSATSSATAWAIDQVLQELRVGAGAETEYAERDGVILLQRLRPDGPVNGFKAAENGTGLDPVVKGLHETEAQVRIQAEKIGTLQSLTWCETAVSEVPMEPGMVEIEVMAVGVNFKVSNDLGNVAHILQRLLMGVQLDRMSLQPWVLFQRMSIPLGVNALVTSSALRLA